MPLPPAKPRRSRFLITAIIFFAIGIAAAIAAPILLRAAVTSAVDSALTKANISGLTYRITSIGLFSAEIADLQYSAAPLPRLAAARITYTPTLLRNSQIDSLHLIGLDLSASYTAGKLSLGPLDPLLSTPASPTTSTPPDLTTLTRAFHQIRLTSSTLRLTYEGKSLVIPLDATLTSQDSTLTLSSTLFLLGSPTTIDGTITNSPDASSYQLTAAGQLLLDQLSFLLPPELTSRLTLTGQANYTLALSSPNLTATPTAHLSLTSTGLQLNYLPLDLSTSSHFTAQAFLSPEGAWSLELAIPKPNQPTTSPSPLLTASATPGQPIAVAVNIQSDLPQSLTSLLFSYGLDTRAVKAISLTAGVTISPDFSTATAGATLSFPPAPVRLIGIAAGNLSTSLTAKLDHNPQSTTLTLPAATLTASNLTSPAIPAGLILAPANLSLDLANTSITIPTNAPPLVQIPTGTLTIALPNLAYPPTAQLSGLSGVLPFMATYANSNLSLTLTDPAHLTISALGSPVPGVWQTTDLSINLAGTTLTHSPDGLSLSAAATLAPSPATVDALALNTGQVTLAATLTPTAPLSGVLTIAGASVNYPAPASTPSTTNPTAFKPTVTIPSIQATLPFTLGDNAVKQGTLTSAAVLVSGVSCPGITGTFDLTPTQLAAAFDWPLLDAGSVKASGWVDISGSRRLMGANLWMDEFQLTDLEELRQIFTPLRTVSASGTLKLNAALEWDGNRAYPHAEFTFKDAAISSRQHDADLTGLSGYIYLDSLFPPSSLPNQQVTVATARFGKLTATDGALAFRLEPPTKDTPAGSLLVEKSRFAFAGGSVESRGFRLAFHDSSTELVLNAGGLQLQSVIDLLTDKAAGTGLLYARIPVSLRFPEVTAIGHGFLYAEPGSGSLSVKDLTGDLRASLDASLGAGQGDPTLDTVRQRVLGALFNFRYDVFRADFRPEITPNPQPNQDWLLTNLRISGRGAPGTGEQVLDLTTNLRFTLQDLNKLLAVKKQ